MPESSSLTTAATVLIGGLIAGPIGIAILVPVEHSRRYVDAARGAGGDARLRLIDGADHVALIDPGAPAWAVVREEVLALLWRRAWRQNSAK